MISDCEDRRCLLFWYNKAFNGGLEGESEHDVAMVEKDMKTLLEKAHNVIFLSLNDKVLGKSWRRRP